MSNFYPTQKRHATTSLSARHRAPKVTHTRTLDAETRELRHEAALDTLVHILDTYFALKAQAREERVIQW